MHQRLGVQFGEVSENGQAEIHGVPAELLTMWSKRTHADPTGQDPSRVVTGQVGWGSQALPSASCMSAW